MSFGGVCPLTACTGQIRWPQRYKTSSFHAVSLTWLHFPRTHTRSHSVTVTGPEASQCWDDTLNLAPFSLERPRTIRPMWANTQPFVKRLSGADSLETDPVHHTDSVHTHATVHIHLPVNLSFCYERMGEMRRAERRG